MDYYFTIDRPSTAAFKDRGSKFIAHAFPVKDAASFKKLLQGLKKDHPKAVHHCFAYRLGTTGDNYRLSDDGEPAGTPGKPILAQLDSKMLTDTAIIITRYFGGTLLGVPGLINAYKTSAALVLQTVPVIKKQIELLYSLQFDYSQVNDIMQVIRQYNCTVIQQEIQLFSIIKIGIPKKSVKEVVDKIKNLRNVQIENLL